MKKKVVSVLLATAMTAVLLGGCGGSAKTESKSTAAGSEAAGKEESVKTTMTVWGPQEDQSKESGEWLQKTCEEFASEHPDWDITFEYAVCPESDAKSTVTQDPEGQQMSICLQTIT